MSVIAYRDGIMAADSLLSDGSDIRRGAVQKIHRTKRRELVGLCGDHTVGVVFLSWLAGDRSEYPSLQEYGELFGAILVDQAGVVSVFDAFGVPITYQAEYYAEGAGNALALGAMAAGASAEQAVEAAVKHSTACQGPVQVQPLQQTPGAVVRRLSIANPPG